MNEANHPPRRDLQHNLRINSLIFSPSHPHEGDEVGDKSKQILGHGILRCLFQFYQQTYHILSTAGKAI